MQRDRIACFRGHVGQCQNEQFQEREEKTYLEVWHSSAITGEDHKFKEARMVSGATVPRDLRLRHFLNKYCKLATDLLAKSTGGYTHPPLRTSPDVPNCLTCGLTNSPQSFGRRPLSQGPAPKSRQPHRPSHPPPPCSPNCCCRVRRCWALSLRRLRGSRCSLDSPATPSGGEQCTGATAPRRRHALSAGAFINNMHNVAHSSPSLASSRISSAVSFDSLTIVSSKPLLGRKPRNS